MNIFQLMTNFCELFNHKNLYFTLPDYWIWYKIYRKEIEFSPIFIVDVYVVVKIGLNFNYDHNIYIFSKNIKSTNYRIISVVWSSAECIDCYKFFSE